MKKGHFAQVILSTAHTDIDKIFDYEIPFLLMADIQLGMRVLVPFGFRNTSTEGYVVGFTDQTQVPEFKIKAISSIMDKYSVFSKEMIELAWWMKEKYYTTLTQCLQTIMPTGINMKNEVKTLILNISGSELEEEIETLKKYESRRVQLMVIELLQHGEYTAATVKSKLKITDSAIKTLLKRGVIKENIHQQRRKLFDAENIQKTAPLRFTEEQKNAFDIIMTEGEKPVLVHGVTGSGKTEIYLQSIEKVIAMGKQAIVLVPEISLTPQMTGRFISRFGEKVAVSHSRMSAGERIDVWQRAKNSEISIMIGPRSAVFTPFNNLGIIIIDEEHEGSYKSDTTPKYDAREVAEFRCAQSNAKMVYGTATPSLKTYYRVEKGEISLVVLKDRPLNRPMPQTEIVDMRRELEEGNRSIFSRKLYEEMKAVLSKGQQIMLFINRRGFSTFVSCRKCGHVMMCTSCNVSYTYHSAENQLRCHYCGKKVEVPKICPECGSKYIKYFGTGTQKVEDEVHRYFPRARVLRMDMDTTKKKNSYKNILTTFGNGEADILIGTQMIAKGHDFPKVTLVGIIAADLSLNSGDFRGGETTFQLITQVSGRAGRDSLAGKVVIQTYQPESYIINLAAQCNYEEFYEKETLLRKTMAYPPFSNIFTVLAFGKNEKDVIDEIQRLSYILIEKNSNKIFEILGPSPAIISKIKDEYRWRIFVKGENEDELRKFVTDSVDKFRMGTKKSSVLLNIALNSQSII
ncbi:MAG TPA: primosomal protein N' [Lachnospiraceae bacterium]|nr:primosomal protein N' [Lachnospiraceae bacterium]